jgi:hypothetical protein
MIHRRHLILAGAGLAALSGVAAAETEPSAFPGAKGWAASTPGGRGGRILRVTHLGSRGPRSFREAIEAEGPRIVVFEVGGVIDLQGDSLRLSNPFITIAGQTAPEPGVTLIRGGLGISAHDVIIRHIRIRPGANGAAPRSGWEVDGLSTTDAHDVIIDQCSFSWATDENLSASGPRFAGGDSVEAWRRHTSRRITFSRNIVAEGLSHSSHAKGEHSKGTLIHDNATEVLIVGNLYAHNYERNQLFKGGAHAVSANNLIYNPGNRCMHYGLNASEWEDRPWETGQLSLVGNVTRGGASTRADLPFFLAESQGDVALYAYDNPAFHADGRVMQAAAIQSDRDLKIITLDAPPFWPEGFVARPSRDVPAWIEAQAGARPWARDAIDQRILRSVRDGAGRIIDDEKEVGGYPSLASVRQAFVDREWDLATMSPLRPG